MKSATEVKLVLALLLCQGSLLLAQEDGRVSMFSNYFFPGNENETLKSELLNKTTKLEENQENLMEKVLKMGETIASINSSLAQLSASIPPVKTARFFLTEKNFKDPNGDLFRSECEKMNGVPGYIDISDVEQYFEFYKELASDDKNLVRFWIPMVGTAKDNLEWMNGEKITIYHPMRGAMEIPNNNSNCWFFLKREKSPGGYAIYDNFCSAEDLQLLCKEII